MPQFFFRGIVGSFSLSKLLQAAINYSILDHLIVAGVFVRCFFFFGGGGGSKNGGGIKMTSVFFFFRRGEMLMMFFFSRGRC